MRVFDRRIGERIRRARIEAGLTQEELAERVGSSQDALSNYERGTRKISLDGLVAIAKCVNKPINYFLEVHDAVVIVRDSRIYEIIQDIEEHPGEIDLLCDIWDFLKTRRSRAK